MLLQRGVTKVSGADADYLSIECCQQFADNNGYSANFMKTDIEKEEVVGVYDIVLLLDGLQSFRNPICALDALTRATREQLVIGIDDDRTFRSVLGGIWSLISNVFQRLPVVYLDGSGKKDWNGVNHFLFSDRAVATLLTRHRYSFAWVDFFPWNGAGRRLAVARKRQIEHLVIVAGVPTSGKSTIMKS